MFVCCVGSGLCDELIARPEESYRVCMCVCMCVCLYVCVYVCVYVPETSTIWRPRPDSSCCAKE
jgi:hypothetical protein